MQHNTPEKRKVLCTAVKQLSGHQVENLIKIVNSIIINSPPANQNK